MHTDESVMKGQVVVVMAPTGSGKTTLVRHLASIFPELHLTVSCTTRAPRAGEVPGREYHFLSHDDFEAKIKAGEFIEWAEYGGNFYGTLKSEVFPYIATPRVVLVEVELQGMLQLKQMLPPSHLTVLYIEAGEWEVLRERVLARSPMSEADLARRHDRYLVEYQSKQYADHIIDNTATDKSMQRAKEELEAIISSIYAKLS